MRSNGTLMQTMLCARGQLGLEVAVQHAQPLQAGAVRGGQAGARPLQLGRRRRKLRAVL